MKSKKIIQQLLLLTILSMVPIWFSFVDWKADLYLFADHERYAENIAYDLFGYISIIVLIRAVYLLIPERKYKRYAFDFLFISWLQLIGYVLFYSQYMNIILVPVLVVMLLISYTKNKTK